MGMVRIEVAGSFGKHNTVKTFSAQKHGHADAVANAIAYLSGVLLPAATALDHQLHDSGDKPSHGFSRTPEAETVTAG
jgi:hypothetical protein